MLCPGLFAYLCGGSPFRLLTHFRSFTYLTKRQMTKNQPTLTPSAIERIARVAHEANRAWCAVNGDFSQMPWEESPDWQKKSAINGVEFVLQNPWAPPSSNHENWLKVKQSEGWVYGNEKDASKKTHPCMVPYEELPHFQKAKDALFRNVVLALIS
jgi:hypothetical protein